DTCADGSLRLLARASRPAVGGTLADEPSPHAAPRVSRGRGLLCAIGHRGRGSGLLRFERARFHYDPYPICIIPDLFDPGAYKALVESYPPVELFSMLPEVGEKYVLSEKHNGRAYRRFIADNPVWRELHGWIKSDALIDAVDACLKRNQVDLGLRAYRQSAP